MLIFMKSFILSKKKLINTHQLYKPFPKAKYVFDTGNFSLKYVKQILGLFARLLNFLQFDILHVNME